MTRSCDTSVVAEIRIQKEEMRHRIECDPRLSRDFEFLIAKSGLKPPQLLTGLWLDCNMMKADRQTLHSREKREIWPISEAALRRTVKNIRNVALHIELINKTDFSPIRTRDMAEGFVGLPDSLSAYATELHRKVDITSGYWKRRRDHIPGLVSLARQSSVYERIRSITGGYHQSRLLRLVNVSRDVQGYPKIRPRAFTIWLNRLEKARKEQQPIMSG